ncbi:unnamed protein product [Closterium sp. NIES-53]
MVACCSLQGMHSPLPPPPPHSPSCSLCSPLPYPFPSAKDDDEADMVGCCSLKGSPLFPPTPPPHIAPHPRLPPLTPSPLHLHRTTTRQSRWVAARRRFSLFPPPHFHSTPLLVLPSSRPWRKQDDDEADTVGCCSLKVEHVTLVPPSSLQVGCFVPPASLQVGCFVPPASLQVGCFVPPASLQVGCFVPPASLQIGCFLPPASLQFDFLGKDSIRYFNTVEVEPLVYKAIGTFRKGKKKDEDLFDKLDTTRLNSHLKEIMPGLTAKVFRTYNASVTLDTLLQDTVGSLVVEKVADYQRANKEVAILCNHQRAVSKAHSAQMEKMQAKLKELEDAVEEMEEDLDRAQKGRPPVKREAEGARKVNPEALEKKLAQSKARLEKMKLDMSIKDELKTVALGTSKINYMDPRITIAWCKRHEVPIEKRHEVLMGKVRVLLNIPSVACQPGSHTPPHASQCCVGLVGLVCSLSLCTSKINYMDPRITIAWCKRHDVPIEKVCCNLHDVLLARVRQNIQDHYMDPHITVAWCKRHDVPIKKEGVV